VSEQVDQGIDPTQSIQAGQAALFSAALKRVLLLTSILAALLPASASAFQLRIFHTPDGNIGCAMIFGKDARGGEARCDIDEHTWPTPPTPKSCELDYGQGLAVGPHRKAAFVCAGDTVLHQGKVLPVGQAVKLGPYRCKSLAGAVRCLNRRTSHGFKLSREVAERF
jgi:Family of unknown function (DUF6636)